ncbi:MAG TPA: nitroreductase [Eubacteriaceae bacterium]|nr:nitroreductase [Eubacteriaceae bacterium]
MNEVIECIKSRRSYRNYKEEPIPRDLLKNVVETGIYAPSARNQQLWHFTIIENQEIIQEMTQAIKAKMKQSDSDFLKKRAAEPNFSPFYQAPAVVLVSIEKDSPWGEIDCGLAAGNIALTAESFGLGTCIVGMTRLIFQSEEAQKYQEMCKIPQGHEVLFAIAIGYKPDQTPDMPEKNKDVIHFV